MLANDYNLTNRDLAITIRTLVDGATAAVYRENGKDYDIVVQLRPEDRASVETISGRRFAAWPANATAQHRCATCALSVARPPSGAPND